jgi:hypothetical protein
MIEFGLKKRATNGKKSRFLKKFPRKKILHRRDEKAAFWFKNNWIDDNYIFLKGNLDRFLKSNVGRPVDKVFSEFLDRCNKSASVYNLRKWFYDMFKEKSEIGWSGGFYITNGILNYKKRTRKPKSKPYISMCDYNRQLIPDIAALCKQCEISHLKQPMGVFELIHNVLKSVYVVERNVWLSDLKLQAHYKLCSIYGVGRGVSKIVWNFQDKMYRATYELWDGCRWDNLPEFVFITRIREK